MANILVIEDTRELGQVITRELEAGGHTCTLCADGLSGLERFSAGGVDLVLLDWMLPKMDGLEVLRRIRAQSSIPVIMLTARGGLTDRVVGLELGADDYLVKPFELPELVARVHALLRRSSSISRQVEDDRAGSGRSILWQEIEIDPQAYACRIQGQPVELTHIEFELLYLLVRNPGRTFTRRYLQETVWNQPFLEGDRSADNTIMRLRRKLGPYADSLETVRGVGYRLKNPQS
jgi:two-component system phosphate regulon response regulator PhoB